MGKMLPLRLERVGAALLTVHLGVLSFSTALVAQGTEHNVPFLTVRDLGAQDGPSPYFGDARSSLRAGRCLLQEVDTGGLSLVLENGPSFLREQLLRIEQVTVEPPSDVLAGVQASASGSLALYVHGYFIDFDKGCRRAALLQSNAGLDGRMIWFSWPSDGDIANYAPDESDLYWSVPDIADAIVTLNAQPGAARRADVIGHSLGARGVALALHEIAYRYPDVTLGNIVLLAADMDFEIFAKLLPRIAPIAERITVYVADADRPLALSEQLHGYRRLGQSGNDVGLLEGVEVIDVAGVPIESASGHLYHIHNGHVGRDLDLLLNGGLHADERENLQKIGPNLWVLTPE